MNLTIKNNQSVTVITTKDPVSGNFQGFTILNQLPHLVLTTTSLEADKIVLIPVTQIVSINYELKGLDRL
jgi:hypothetical protein